MGKDAGPDQPQLKSLHFNPCPVISTKAAHLGFTSGGGPEFLTEAGYSWRTNTRVLRPCFLEPDKKHLVWLKMGCKLKEKHLQQWEGNPEQQHPSVGLMFHNWNVRKPQSHSRRSSIKNRWQPQVDRCLARVHPALQCLPTAKRLNESKRSPGATRRNSSRFMMYRDSQRWQQQCPGAREQNKFHIMKWQKQLHCQISPKIGNKITRFTSSSSNRLIHEATGKTQNPAGGTGDPVHQQEYFVEYL